MAALNIWGVDDYGRPVGPTQPVPVAAPPGYRLSENVNDRRAPMGKPFVPSQRAQYILSDLDGPTSEFPAISDFARNLDEARMAVEIEGLNQPRIDPGLSRSLGDRELRNSVFDALNGRDLYPAPAYTGPRR
jgi:hypothetical protein